MKPGAGGSSGAVVGIVTGGSSGLGLKIAEGLARAGCRVFITSRSETRAADAAERIRRETGNRDVEGLPLDLASFDSIRGFAAEFTRRGLPLHILVNNAGVFAARGRTQEGFERIWGTNYAGHFLLTGLLFDVLRSSPPARILNVVSDFAYRAGPLNWDSFTARSGLNTLKCYAASKLCLVLWTKELARRLEGSGVAVTAFHPGFLRSNISLLHRFAALFRAGATAEQAAAPALSWLLSADTDRTTCFIGPAGNALPLPQAASDDALVSELWERSSRWTGAFKTSSMPEVSYDPADGISGPYALSMAPEMLRTITDEIRANVLPRAPLKSIFTEACRLVGKREAGSLLVLLLQCLRNEFYMERHLDCAPVKALCQDPAIMSALKTRLGENPVLWRSEIWVNRPAERLLAVWHHDTYPKLLSGPGRSLNVYIALTDVREDNGFEYLPISALHETQPAVKITDIFSGNHFFKVSPALERVARPVSLRAGEFILFDNELIHRSVHNTSGKVRVSLTLRVIQPSVTAKPGYSVTHRPVPLSGNF